MTNPEQHTWWSGGRSRWYLLAGALLAFIIVVITVLVVSRDGDPVGSSSSGSPSAGTTAPNSTTALDDRSAVVARLQEILLIREQAFKQRDASLFDDVYTSTCSCLQAGREAIAALKKENVRWQNRSISIEVQSARSINPQLWEVVALFISDPFRIETEKGVLVREVPAERIRYRFLLVRASDAEPWRLGSASLVEGQG